MNSILKYLSAVACLAVFGVTKVEAQVPFTLPFSTGWETGNSPTWNAGPLAGQNGWIADTMPSDAEMAVGMTMINSQTVTPKTGAQMVMSKSSYAGDALQVAGPDTYSLATSA